MKMSTESPKRLSFLLTPSTKPPSVYTEPSWPGRGEFRGTLAGGPPEEDSPPAGSGFPRVPPRQLQGKAHLHLGTETPATCSHRWKSWFTPHPTPHFPPGVLLPEFQRRLVQAICPHSGKHSKRPGQVGWRFGFSPWLPVTLSLSLPACKMVTTLSPSWPVGLSSGRQWLAPSSILPDQQALLPPALISPSNPHSPCAPSQERPLPPPQGRQNVH